MSKSNLLVTTLFLLATCVLPVANFWFFSCRHGNGNGRPGDACSVFCQCREPNTCMAGAQRCVKPAKHAEPCHATRPCGKGLSCHPGIQRCYFVPRRLLEPCVAGYECGSGLTCEPGVQVCYHRLRQYNEPCVGGFPCARGLTCQPGVQRCLHHPRRENEACSLGFECGEGLECTMCSRPYLTCQMASVPRHDNEFYKRPYNMVAFLVTHNSYSHGARYAVWARNQRVDIGLQLSDGVRGLMLDIFPGWGKAEVSLCHETCFWGGATDLLVTLIDIRKFLEENPREVVTIIFEDYLRNPTVLKHVFDKAGVSRHVLPSMHWGTFYKNWPTLDALRMLGRLIVFNNNGLAGFPYTEDNMWFFVRENRYGQHGLNTETCEDRGESSLNADFSDNWRLVLINWFGTATNPLNPCLNSYTKIKRKLATCAREFGQLANFLAVDYYKAGQDGGAFKAVKLLNNQWKDLYLAQSLGLTGEHGTSLTQDAPRDADKLGAVIRNNSSKGVSLQEVYDVMDEVDSDERLDKAATKVDDVIGNTNDSMNKALENNPGLTTGEGVFETPEIGNTTTDSKTKVIQKEGSLSTGKDVIGNTTDSMNKVLENNPSLTADTGGESETPEIGNTTIDSKTKVIQKEGNLTTGKDVIGNTTDSMNKVLENNPSLTADTGGVFETPEIGNTTTDSMNKVLQKGSSLTADKDGVLVRNTTTDPKAKVMQKEASLTTDKVNDTTPSSIVGAQGMLGQNDDGRLLELKKIKLTADMNKPIELKEKLSNEESKRVNLLLALNDMNNTQESYENSGPDPKGGDGTNPKGGGVEINGSNSSTDLISTDKKINSSTFSPNSILASDRNSPSVNDDFAKIQTGASDKEGSETRKTEGRSPMISSQNQQQTSNRTQFLTEVIEQI